MKNSLKIRPHDYAFYLVTDSIMTGRDRLTDTVRQAVEGGVTIVQYREKEDSTANMIRQAILLREILHQHGIPLIINDRVDVALAAGADGVHLGRNDMPPETARTLMGVDKIIGFSVETLDEVRKVEKNHIDYLGVSPIYATPTKTDTGKPWGLEGLRELRKLTPMPLVAIGGMNRETIPDTLKAGADGVAVVSAICASDRPFESARELRTLIDQHTIAH